MQMSNYVDKFFLTNLLKAYIILMLFTRMAKNFKRKEDKKEVEKQMETLGTIKNMLKYKCWYYDRAVAAGTEDVVKNLSIDEIPREVRDYKI